MPLWKNWAASPPTTGHWVQARHPSVGQVFNLDPGSVPAGSDMSNTEWLDLTVADPVPLKIISVLSFKELFTADEFVAIKASTDHKVMQFMDMVNTPSVAYVNLQDTLVSNGINYLAGIGLLTAPRAAAILSNAPPA